MINEYTYKEKYYISISDDKKGERLLVVGKNENIDDKLMKENEFEILDNIFKRMIKEVYENESNIKFCNTMIKFQPLVVAITTLMAFIIGGYNSSDFIVYGIYNGMYGLFVSLIGASVYTIGCSVFKSKSNKKISALNETIVEIKKMEDEIKKESKLENEKEFSLEEPTINKPISLIERTKELECEIDSEINQIYMNAMKSKTRKLVRNDRYKR